MNDIDQTNVNVGTGDYNLGNVAIPGRIGNFWGKKNFVKIFCI
jgi:hypothetical protein